MRLWNSTSPTSWCSSVIRHNRLGSNIKKERWAKGFSGIADTVSFNVPDWDGRDHGGGVKRVLQADYPPRVSAGQHELGGECH